MSTPKKVARPVKRTEFTICLPARQAQDGWRDVLATQRNAVVDAWDFLTRHPLEATASNYPLKGGTGIRQVGRPHTGVKRVDETARGHRCDREDTPDRVGTDYG